MPFAHPMHSRQKDHVFTVGTYAIVLPYTNARVGGAKVNADGFSFDSGRHI